MVFRKLDVVIFLAVTCRRSLELAGLCSRAGNRLRKGSLEPSSKPLSSSPLFCPALRPRVQLLLFWEGTADARQLGVNAPAASGAASAAGFNCASGHGFVQGFSMTLTCSWGQSAPVQLVSHPGTLYVFLAALPKTSAWLPCSPPLCSSSDYSQVVMPGHIWEPLLTLCQWPCLSAEPWC